MKFEKRREGESDTGPRMASMIDVVFLLLIFFMCATKFKVFEGLFRGELDLRHGPLSAETVPVTEPPNVFPARIVREGDVRVIGFGEHRFTDLETFRGTLTELRAVNPSAKILVDAEGELPWQWVMDVMDACRAERLEVIQDAPLEDAG